MEKYEKLFKGLEMCAGPECHEECPYHGETRGGKTCRAWLLNDAAVALASEESRAEACMTERDKLNQDITFIIQQRDNLAADNNVLRTVKAELDEELHRTQQREAALLKGEVVSKPEKPQKPEPGLAETMDIALKATMRAEYWRGQAEAMKEFMRFYLGGQAVEDVGLDLPDMHGEPEPEATDNV